MSDGGRRVLLNRVLLHWLILALLPSCTYIRKEYGRPLHHDGSTLEAGTDDLAAVLEVLGPPSQVSAMGSGFALLYESLGITERQLGLSFGNLIPQGDLIEPSVGWAATEREDLLLIFDAERRLVDRRYMREDISLGLGGGVETIFTVSNLVDTSSLQDPFDVHAWGTELLEPLPRALNRGQSLDHGEAGLQLRGTPTRVGQHTLDRP